MPTGRPYPTGVATDRYCTFPLTVGLKRGRMTLDLRITLGLKIVKADSTSVVMRRTATGATGGHTIHMKETDIKNNHGGGREGQGAQERRRGASMPFVAICCLDSGSFVFPFPPAIQQMYHCGK